MIGSYPKAVTAEFLCISVEGSTYFYFHNVLQKFKLGKPKLFAYLHNFTNENQQIKHFSYLIVLSIIRLPSD